MILGTMAELGGLTLEAFHCEIGAHAARAGVDLLVPVGAPAPRLSRGLRRRGAGGGDA